MKILEMIQGTKQKLKILYMPSELNQKHSYIRIDFLYTDPNERRILLEQTYKLGNKLAIKFKRHIKQASKGKITF